MLSPQCEIRFPRDLITFCGSFFVILSLSASMLTRLKCLDIINYLSSIALTAIPCLNCTRIKDLTGRVKNSDLLFFPLPPSLRVIQIDHYHNCAQEIKCMPQVLVQKIRNTCIILRF